MKAPVKAAASKAVAGSNSEKTALQARAEKMRARRELEAGSSMLCLPNLGFEIDLKKLPKAPQEPGPHEATASVGSKSQDDSQSKNATGGWDDHSGRVQATEAQLSGAGAAHAARVANSKQASAAVRQGYDQKHRAEQAAARR